MLAAAIPSPDRAPIEILTSVNVTPNAGRVRALLPLTETTSATDTSIKVQPQTITDCKNDIKAGKLQNVPGIAKVHAAVPGLCLHIRSTSCFKDCCYTQGLVFPPTCPGWKKTKVRVLKKMEREVVMETERGGKGAQREVLKETHTEPVKETEREEQDIIEEIQKEVKEATQSDKEDAVNAEKRERERERERGRERERERERMERERERWCRTGKRK